MITAFEFESPQSNILNSPPENVEYVTEYYGRMYGYNRCVKIRLQYWTFIGAYYAVDGTDEEGDAELAILMCRLKVPV